MASLFFLVLLLANAAIISESAASRQSTPKKPKKVTSARVMDSEASSSKPVVTNDSSTKPELTNDSSTKPELTNDSSTKPELTNDSSTKPELTNECKLREACVSPWVLVGGSCLFIDLSVITTWRDARNNCKEKHKSADLATFKDANEFAEILRHIRTINSAKLPVSIWIGGEDENDKNNWKWINGEPMPMGSPFWGGDTTGNEQPETNNNELCTILASNNGYFINDANCDRPLGAPLCQYRN